MARQTNGSSQALASAATLDLSAAGSGSITVAFWLWVDAFSSNDELAMEFSSNYNSNEGAFIIDPNDGTAGGVFTFASHGNGGYRAVRFARPSAAAWHHYMLVFNQTATANMVGYVDGSSVSLTTTTDTNGGTWGNFTLYVMSRASSSLWLAGRIAGLGIWTSALTSGNATSLAGGAAPSTIGTPAFAWNICGAASPEPASNGGIDLTVVGSAPQVDDPAAFAGVCSGGGPTTWGPLLGLENNRLVQ